MEENKKEEFDNIYFTKLNMCGCGRPEDVKLFLFMLLDNLNKYRLKEITYDVMSANRKKIITETDPEVIFEFVFHVLDGGGFLEHGSSVYSAWFTDEGQKFYELLKEDTSGLQE